MRNSERITHHALRFTPLHFPGHDADVAPVGVAQDGQDEYRAGGLSYQAAMNIIHGCYAVAIDGYNAVAWPQTGPPSGFASTATGSVTDTFASKRKCRAMSAIA